MHKNLTFKILIFLNFIIISAFANTAPVIHLPLSLDESLIDNSIYNTRYSLIADLDDDGNMDILSNSEYADAIYWHKNNGSESFTKNTLTTGLNNPSGMKVIDLDEDGDKDIIYSQNNKISWLNNNGSESFTNITISSSVSGNGDVFIIDVDEDNDLDIVSASQNDDKIAWYENDGSENFTQHIITTNADRAMSVYAIDIDGDTDIDVVSASWNDDTIAWYENDGNESFTKHIISDTEDMARDVISLDFDNDGDIDVIAGITNEDSLVWYENDGSENFTANVITTNADGVQSVDAKDLDGDGDIDLVSASANNDQIVWYENNANTTFTEHLVDTYSIGAQIALIEDIDSNGTNDIFAMSYRNEMYWYTNTQTNEINVEENTTAVANINITDPENDTITYSISGGLDSDKFSINSSGALTFDSAHDYENPTDNDTNNSYLVEITGTDNGVGSLTTTQAFIVNVTDINEAPSITNNAAVTMDENISAVTTITSTDPENNTVSYSITGGADSSKFSINSSSGALTFDSAPDYENPTDSDTNNTYIVEVTASDNGQGSLTDIQTLTITINEINEAPSITNNTNIVVAENQTAVTTVTAVDQENNTITYTINGGADSTAFTIDDSTGVLSFNSTPNAEIQNFYEVIIRVSDSLLHSDTTFSISVTNVDEGGPSITGVPITSLNENEVYTYNPVATDPDNDELSWEVKNGTTLPTWLSLEKVLENITTIVGTGGAGYSGDNGFATSAQLQYPSGIDIDDQGNIYVVDLQNHVVRRIDTNGIITTIAGTGVAGYSGDGGLATSAQLQYPYGIKIDTNGNIFIADKNNHRVRKIDTSGIITTIAGTGATGYSGDNGLATSARLFYPSDIDFDSNGNIYIADMGYSTIRKIDSNGIITTVAGTGTSNSNGDTGTATSIHLWYPQGIAIDSNDNLYIADRASSRIRKVDSNGMLTTLSLTYREPYGINVDSNDNIYIAYRFDGIVKVDTNGNISTIAGTGTNGFSGDGGLATAAQVNYPKDLVIDNKGNILIADTVNNRIRKISSISTLKGTAPYISESYNVDLTVSDGITSADHSFQITVNDINNPPIITNNPTIISLVENQVTATTITFTEYDNNTVTYSISGGADSSKFTINSSSGVLSFISAPNFEIPTDSDNNNSYIVDITVIEDSIGSLTDTETFTINITDTYEDSDNDGLADGTDPNDSNTDSDGDGILDGIDVDVNGDGTLDNGIDADNDGIKDSADADLDGIPGTDSGKTDSDGDGIIDSADPVNNSLDSDNDGLADEIDPNDSNTDSDGDGILDGIDVDVNGDGTLDNGIDADNDGIKDSADADLDGIPGTDSGKTDSDGDGIIDSSDSDIDGDGIGNTDDLDTDGDNILNSVETNIDTDNDGLPNSSDVDSDNDGKLDKDEGLLDNDLDGIKNYLDSNDNRSDSVIDNNDGTESITFNNTNSPGDNNITQITVPNGTPLAIVNNNDNSSELTITDPNSTVDINEDGSLSVEIDQSNGTHNVTVENTGTDVSLDSNKNLILSTPLIINEDTTICQYDIELKYDGSDMITKHYINKGTSSEIITTIIIKIPNSSMNINKNDQVIHLGEFTNEDSKQVKVTTTVSCDGSIESITNIVNENETYISLNNPGSTVVIDTNGNVDTTTALEEGSSDSNQLEGLNFKIDSKTGNITASKVLKDKTTNQVIYTEAQTYLAGAKLSSTGNNISEINVDLTNVRLVNIRVTDSDNNVITSTMEIQESVVLSDITRISSGETGAVSTKVNLTNSQIEINNKLDGKIEHKLTIGTVTTQAISNIEGSTTVVSSTGVITSYDDSENNGIKTQVEATTTGEAVHKLDLNGVITQATSKILGANTLIIKDENNKPKISTTVQTNNSNNEQIEIVVNVNANGSAEHKIILNGTTTQATSQVTGATTTIKTSGEVETISTLGNNNVTMIAETNGESSFNIVGTDFNTSVKFQIEGAQTTLKETKETQTTLSTKESMCSYSDEYILVNIISDQKGKSTSQLEKYSCNDDSQIEIIKTLNDQFEAGNTMNVTQENGDLTITIETPLNDSIQF